MSNKNVYIIAGPNGSGKTTFATMFLPEYVQCSNFVNADLIAKGLSPFEPRLAAIKAGRLVLKQIYEFAQRGVDFAFETTLAGKSYINLFYFLKGKGYELHLFFLWIPNVELAIERIKDRVAQGGHHVPSDDVRRRFERSLHHLYKFYEPLLDSWTLFDNSGEKPNILDGANPKPLLRKKKDGRIELFHQQFKELLQRFKNIERRNEK